MMKTGRVVSCCVALLLALTSVSAVERKLDSIYDLKEIHYGSTTVPRHIILLLYWFANAVDIAENGIMRLTFDPESRAYGSHHYGNYEGLLEALPRGGRYQYYTLGSLNQESPSQLPYYVVNPPVSGYGGNNRDRIIVRIRDRTTGEQVPQMIDQVYITRHLNQQQYDPDHTYRITTNLLRQIREFAGAQNYQQRLQLRNRYGSNADVIAVGNTWIGLAGLGLLLFIVILERPSFTQQNSRLQSHDTTQYNYTPQHQYTPQHHYTPQHNYGQTNNGVSDDTMMCLFFGLVVMCLIIFLAFLGINTK